MFFFAALVGVRGAGAHTKEKEPPHPPPSEWCKEHPEQCADYQTRDEWIDQQVRDCVDDKGNRNGKAEQWEIEKFADACR